MGSGVAGEAVGLRVAGVAAVEARNAGSVGGLEVVERAGAGVGDC
jgi:hypothetical protein